MKSKIILSVLAIAAIAVVAYFASYHPAPHQQLVQSEGSAMINSNVGSVAGVDLSAFANEANQSASLSEQDSANAAAAVPADGAAISSSIDSVSGPIK